MIWFYQLLLSEAMVLLMIIFLLKYQHYRPLVFNVPYQVPFGTKNVITIQVLYSQPINEFGNTMSVLKNT